MPPGEIRYLEGVRCTTDVLAESGWACGLSGKWHLGDSLHAQHGYSHWFCHRSGAGSYNDQPMIRNGRVEPTSGYVTDIITDDALAFIGDNRERPFYLGVHYTAPHSPWTGHPAEIVASYRECAFRSCPQEERHPWAGPLTRLSLGSRDCLEGYFAAVTAMDANIGRILDRLDRLGLRESTLVIFASDNGFSCGHHGFWGKGNGTFPLNMYENSVRVPMVASHPGVIPAGRRSSAMMSQYDVMPTLLDYAGLSGAAADYGGPGVSFRDVLLGKRSEARDEVVVYTEYGPVRMIRTAEWKYVHRYPFGMHELYDLRRDPDERRNRIDDRSCAAVVAELRQRLSRWFARYGNPVQDGSKLPVTGAGQLSRVADGWAAEASFASDRLAMGDNGFPHVDRQLDLEAFKATTGNVP